MISIVMPSAGRDSAVLRTLEALLGQRPPAGGHEVIVIDTGMDAALAGELGTGRFAGLPLRTASSPGGPAAARNLGTRLAGGEVIMFLDDDKAPAREDLLAGHADLHAASPQPGYAVLGATTWSPERPVTPLMRWLEGEGGGQFAFPAIDAGAVAARSYFYTANVSVKKELLERVGGFDERFPHAALEDIELGVRLEAAGLELDYRPDLLAFHDHPIDLEGSLERATRVGRAASLYMRIHSDPHERIARPSSAKLALGRATKPLWSAVARRERPSAQLPQAWRTLHMLAYAEGLSRGLEPGSR